MIKDKLLAWLKALPFLLIVLFVLNPEIRALAFFVDFIGLDLAVLLLAIQMRFNRRFLMSHVFQPVYDGLCFLSGRPCFVPTLKTVREMPALLLHAIPLMPMFIVGLVLVCAVRLLCELTI